MVPELHPPSPAKKFFTKMAKSFFGKKKAKGKQPRCNQMTDTATGLNIFKVVGEVSYLIFPTSSL